MLTFNVSVDDHNLPTNMPYQIIPNTRTYLTGTNVGWYSGGNGDTVIHVGYPIKPFTNKALEPGSKIHEQLLLYKELALRLHSNYILIHLPYSVNEFINFRDGLILIINTLINGSKPKWTGTVLLEMPSFCKDLQKHLNIKEDFQTAITNYFEYILECLDACNGRIKIILDTAHMYANGCDTIEKYMFITNMCQKHLADVIHLNGNIKETFESDEHIPFINYTNQNKIYKSYGKENYEKMLEHVFKTYRIIVSENNFTKYDYTYNDYAAWAKSKNVHIVPPPNVNKYVLGNNPA